MPVVVCLDKFRGSLSALEAGEALARGLRAGGADTVVLAVADGGEGTVAAVVAGGATPVTRRVPGPDGRPVDAVLAVRGGTAVVEMAQASGLALLGDRPQPLTAGTRGTGELIAAALDLGCRDLVLGVGGSATTDGGAGLLQALGARVLDAAGRDLPPGGAALRAVDRLDLTGLDPRLASCAVTLANDVDNPLLGPDGAPTVFGPQKGAGPEEVAVLEEGLARWAACVAAATGRDLAAAPGAGAAGGTGFAALAVLGAVLRPGIDVVLDALDADARLRDARLVVVGEGRLDESSLHGKAPVGVARRVPPGVPVVAVSGQCDVPADRLAEAGIAGCRTLLDEAGGDVARAMAEAGSLLERVGHRLAKALDEVPRSPWRNFPPNR